MNGANGTGVEYNAYDAWGAIMQSQVSPDIKYKYTSQELDGQTGIYNYRARMYDQSLGRFYATDPAGEAFAPFGYAGNNAISFVDPRGMKQGPRDPRISGPGLSGHIYVLGVDVPIHSTQTISSGPIGELTPLRRTVRMVKLGGKENCGYGSTAIYKGIE
ncbi:MAG: RHS repeat-associated core domain-containing protein, partial [Ignavibacteria bacterium]|nr:RHS repeat-associated core domain-containing protein [Ignavibacteria bacterium]